MNVFQSNSAPFLLALIVSALGWYVGQINSDIRNTKVATYSLEKSDERPGHARVILRNVSRSESLDRFLFALTCRSANRSTGPGRSRHRVIISPPIRPIEHIVDGRTAGQVTVRASLAPGGTIGLEADIPNCLAPLEFYYRPERSDQTSVVQARPQLGNRGSASQAGVERRDPGPSAPLRPANQRAQGGEVSRFLLLNANSVSGWMATNYIDSLPILFLIMLTLFLLWLAIQFPLWWRKRNERPVANDIYTVRLLFGDPSDRKLGTDATDIDDNGAS